MQQRNLAGQPHNIAFPDTVRLVNIGLEAEFARLPARVAVGNRSYYLVHNEAGYRLLSTVCPHKGDIVLDTGVIFECPSHGWRFDRQTGQCLNTPNAQMRSIPVYVEDGSLIAEVPLALALSAPPRAKRGTPLQDLQIHLHAHACLEFVYKGFHMLMDPWIDGPAYSGAWIQYPPPVISADDLRPDVIVITHEHSDHFHPETLNHFDHSIPIYVTDFPNQRMPKRLAELGFTNVNRLAFGDTFELIHDFKLTMFEPDSTWNDAIALLEIEDFRLLNVNDAGLNQRLAAKIGAVDAVASAFSSGASGYPLAWYHLNEEQKHKIMEMACQSKLQMLQQAVDLYGAQYLLPFASHFALWHPLHRHYMNVMLRNTLKDVTAVFEGTSTRIIDLLPGESWDVAEDEISRRDYNRDEWLDQGWMLNYLAEHYDEAAFRQHHPSASDLSREEVEAYLLRLNDVPEIIFSENLTVLLQVMQNDELDSELMAIGFEINAGHLRLLDVLPESPNQIITLPIAILEKIVRDNMSWEEPVIGYWCRLERYPSSFQADFWRLLQAPYFKKPIQMLGSQRDEIDIITEHTIIAKLIERYGDSAERILRRYGLYCAGCHRSTYDSIALGARHHGIDEITTERLVRELNKALA